MKSEQNEPTPLPQFYELHEPAIWGSVGRVFVAGVLKDLESPQVPIRRAGPYVPPISFPWPVFAFSVVVTDGLRRQLEAAALGRFRYRPIIKEHVPTIPWETWDRNVWSPPVSPQGDAASYLSSLPHSPAAAKQMEELWELILPDGPNVESYYLAGRWGESQLLVDPMTWKGDHISRGAGTRLIVVTELAKSFLENLAGEWVRFTPARFERPPRPKFYLVDVKGSLIENPSREDLERHVLSLNEAAKWTRRGGVRLIDSADRCLTALVSGAVQVFNVAANYKLVRQLYGLSRTTQLELLQEHYDGDYDGLMRKDWEEWENPVMSGPLGPGRIGGKPELDSSSDSKPFCTFPIDGVGKG